MKIVYPKHFTLTNDLDFQPLPNTLNYFYTASQDTDPKIVELHINSALMTMFSGENPFNEFTGVSACSYFKEVQPLIKGRLTMAQRQDLEDRNVNIIREHENFQVTVSSCRLNTKIFDQVPQAIALFSSVEFLQHCLTLCLDGKKMPTYSQLYFDQVTNFWQDEVRREVSYGYWHNEVSGQKLDYPDRIIFKITVKSKFLRSNLEQIVEFLPTGDGKFAFVFFDRDISELYVNVFGHNINREVSDLIFDALKNNKRILSSGHSAITDQLRHTVFYGNKQIFWESFVHQLSEDLVRYILRNTDQNLLGN